MPASGTDSRKKKAGARGKKMATATASRKKTASASRKRTASAARRKTASAARKKLPAASGESSRQRAATAAKPDQPAGRRPQILLPAGRRSQALLPAGRASQALLPAGRASQALLPAGRASQALLTDRRAPQALLTDRRAPQALLTDRRAPQALLPDRRARQGLLPAAPARKPKTARGPARPKKLRGLSDVRRFFYRNETPYYFISATNFNLLNLDEWVRRFRFINYIPCFDGLHPNVFVPSEADHAEFTCLEDINNYLLQHKDVVDFIRSRGPGGKALFLFFDEKTEELCRDLGLEICLPRAKLRAHVDNKLTTTRIAERAGVKSVPNVIGKIGSYADLRKLSRRLGDDLVVQTAFGDSGHTTFFISSEADYDRHAAEIEVEREVKIMKRIRCRGSALEACVTRHGTIVGPLMTELIGFKELTPYRGGWCGNEVFADAFPPRVRNAARKAAVAIGAELKKLGYRGYFEVDFLTDLDTGKVYLGELNPRITGASSMTNLAAFAHADAPLILFHLLEWADIDFDIDVAAINERWSDPANIDSWSQLVIKHTEKTVDRVTAAPRSGVWQLASDGRVNFARLQTHRRTVEREDQGFFLRILRAGDYRYEGADLGILLTPGRLMNDDYTLNARAQAWIKGLRQHFAAVPLEALEAAPVAVAKAAVGGFKLL